MIKFIGCYDSNHYECLENETPITQKDFEKQQNKLMCNIRQLYLHLRFKNLSIMF